MIFIATNPTPVSQIDWKMLLEYIKAIVTFPMLLAVVFFVLYFTYKHEIRQFIKDIRKVSVGDNSIELERRLQDVDKNIYLNKSKVEAIPANDPNSIALKEIALQKIDELGTAQKRQILQNRTPLIDLTDLIAELKIKLENSLGISVGDAQLQANPPSTVGETFITDAVLLRTLGRYPELLAKHDLVSLRRAAELAAESIRKDYSSTRSGNAMSRARAAFSGPVREWANNRAPGTFNQEELLSYCRLANPEIYASLGVDAQDYITTLYHRIGPYT